VQNYFIAQKPPVKKNQKGMMEITVTHTGKSFRPYKSTYTRHTLGIVDHRVPILGSISMHREREREREREGERAQN